MTLIKIPLNGFLFWYHRQVWRAH